MRGNLFFYVIAAFMVGVLWRTLQIVPVACEHGLIAASLGCGALWAVSRWKILLLMALVGASILGGIERTEIVPAHMPVAFEPLLNTYVSFPAVVVADPDIRETSDRLTVQIQKGTASMRIIAVAPLYPSYAYGDHVMVSGLLVAPAPFSSDGGRTFNYDQFLAKDGVYAIIQQASVRKTGPPHDVLTSGLRYLYSIKRYWIQAIDRALPEPEASLAVGILVGGKQGLGPTILNDFTIAGMLQIVVLSGYNVMIVAEGILKACSKLPKMLALVIAGLCIGAFVIMAGANSSAVRAGIMALFALVARATNRDYDVLRALLLSLLIIILINPLLLTYDPGLQLSFLATLGLILGVPIIEPKILWIKSAFLRDGIATSACAQIAVLPLLLYQSGNLSLVALPANVLAMGAIPPAMASSAMAGVAGWSMPTISPYIGLPAYGLLWYVIEIAKVSAKLPYAQIIIPAFPAWMLLVAYGSLAGIVILSKKPIVAPVGATHTSPYIEELTRLRSRNASRLHPSSYSQGTPPHTDS